MRRIDQLREQIDSCRAGSDDLHLPELAELARAVQVDQAVAAELDRAGQFDRAVVSALHDVPVPGGLLERLLEKSAGAAASPSIGAAVVVPAKDQVSRRGWLVRLGSVGLAAAAVVTLAVVLSRSGPPESVTREQLARDIEVWAAAMALPGQWQQSRSAPAAFPISADVRGKPHQWRRYWTPGGDPAVVYDLSPPGGSRVLLFVVASRAKYAVSTTPFSVLGGTTGAIQAGAWQHGGFLYVLVVGRDQALENYVRPPRII
jgi:hypothetical protein